MSNLAVFLMRSGLAIIGAAAFLALSCALFVDLMPSPFGGYADQRFLLLWVSCGLTVSLVALYALRPLVASKEFVITLGPTLLLCSAFIGLSLPFYKQEYVWVEPGMYVSFFFITVFSGAWLSWSGANTRYVIYLVSIVAVICTLYGLASINIYLFAVNDGATSLVDFIPWGFVNIRYWSHVATWCIPIMALAALVGPLKHYRVWRCLVMLGAGLWWWVLLLTTGRGSILAILCGVAIAFFLMGRKALPWAKLCLTYFMIGLALWLLLSIILPSFLAEEVQIRGIKTDSSGRIPLFVEAWEMSGKYFPFGMGPQSWLTHEILTDGYSASRKFGHPHNMYLFWAAEYGWFLIALIAGVAAQAIRLFLRARNLGIALQSNENALMLAGLTASVSAALIHAGASAVFIAPASMLVGQFVLIAFWSLIIPQNASKPISGESLGLKKRRKVIALFLAGALAVIGHQWMTRVWVYYDDMRSDEEAYFENVGEGILPRFWFHGNFPRAN